MAERVKGKYKERQYSVMVTRDVCIYKVGLKAYPYILDIWKITKIQKSEKHFGGHFCSKKPIKSIKIFNF